LNFYTWYDCVSVT